MSDSLILGISLTLAVLALTQTDGAHGHTPSLPLGQASFAAYQDETRQWLQQARDFQSPDHNAELDWNAPQEWRPEQPARRGILLVHGLAENQYR